MYACSDLDEENQTFAHKFNFCLFSPLSTGKRIEQEDLHNFN